MEEPPALCLCLDVDERGNMTPVEQSSNVWMATSSGTHGLLSIYTHRSPMESDSENKQAAAAG
jgi:hypothetical protein